MSQVPDGRAVAVASSQVGRYQESTDTGAAACRASCIMSMAQGALTQLAACEAAAGPGSPA